jgi:glycosyltransferase involved in cell wall biosynthesis
MAAWNSASSDSLSDRYSTSFRKRKAATASETSVAILMDAHLNQFDNVRKPAPGFLGRLANKISQTIFPGTACVRGNIIAADTLVDAFIRHGRTTEYDLFIYPEARAAVSAKLNSVMSDIRQHGKNIRINSIADVLGGVDKYQIGVWFNPIPYCSVHGGIEIAHRIRSHFASTPYPVATLYHGLVELNTFYHLYLKQFLYPTLPCDSIICTSRASRDSARKIIGHLGDRLYEELGIRTKYNGRFDLVPLCVNTSEFRPRDKSNVRSKLEIPQNAFIILYLGRISPQKADLYPFLQALRYLVEKNPGRRLLWIIAGTEEPGYSDLLLKHARELNVARHVKVLLNVSDETKSLLLPASDVFVSPVDTLDESFGLTPIEAMACGVPQVVPDWDGYRDTVSHGETGFLIPTYWTDCSSDLTETGIVAGDAFDHLCLGQSIAVDMRHTVRYIQVLMDNPELSHEMAKRSRDRALSVYSCQEVVNQYEELWAELANIAGQLKVNTKTVSFDRFHYYDFFGHYASATLTDETLLQITSLGKEAIVGNASFPPKSIPSQDIAMLDATILRRVLIRSISQRDSPAGSQSDEGSSKPNKVQMGELIRFVGSIGDYHRSYIRRQIMWLIKYLYLEPVFD